MAEGIALAVLGAVGHLYIEVEPAKRRPIEHFSLAAIAGVIMFAATGEPTSATAVGYITAGYFAPSFIKNAVLKWRTTRKRR